MTWDERVDAVRQFGFTERQAGFLVTVMLYSGVCLGRHYCTYSRIAYGQKMHDFFQTLLRREFATVRPCRHPRARLFHIQHKALYRAIGQKDNRHRKPVALARAVERLMLLDAVLADRALNWLGTEPEKVAHFTLQYGVRPSDLPSRTYRGRESETVRHFPDKLPIGIDGDRGRYVFLYLVTQKDPTEFRLFLERHAELWRVLREWTVRLLVPHDKTGSIRRYREAFHQQFAPLSPATVDDMRWFFRARQQTRSGPDERLDEASFAFGTPRFDALYRTYLERGDAALDAAMSPVLADAISRRAGQFECHVLPHRYLHLSTLVGTA